MPKKQEKKKIFETAIEGQQETTFKKVFHLWMWIFVIPLGFIMFFYLGWTYQASWYWYYGIDPVQLNLPLSIIFEQGMMFLLVSFTFILIIFGVVFLLRLIALYLKNFFFGNKRIELASLFSIREFFQRSIHFVAPVCLALLYVFVVGVSTHNSNYPELQAPANVTMLEMLVIPIAAILFILALGDLLSILPVSFKHRLRLKSKFRINDEPYRVSLEVLAIFSALVIFIGINAVGDASVGFRNNGSYQAVRRVYLESYLPIAGLEPYRQGCDCNPYVYGPMGYLANNKEYLFLIPWKADSDKYFTQFPHLYQIERSQTNAINIIPYEDNP